MITLYIMYVCMYIGNSSSSKSLIDLNKEYRLVDMQKYGNFDNNLKKIENKILCLIVI